MDKYCSFIMDPATKARPLIPNYIKNDRLLSEGNMLYVKDLNAFAKYIENNTWMYIYKYMYENIKFGLIGKFTVIYRVYDTFLRDYLIP